MLSAHRCSLLAAAGPRQKLLDRVRHAIRTRHYSRRTAQAYVDWIRRYIAFHPMTHPAQMGASDVSQFLTWLAVDRRVSASTQNQALSALCFLYKHVLAIEITATPPVVGTRTPERLRVVLSREKIGAILKQLTGTQRLFVMVLYGSGVRLEECLALRVKDLDFDRRQIIVRQGKGRKDRVTMLPAAAREGWTGHLADVRRLHERDVARGFGRVVLPFALHRIFPNAATAWRRQFVLPAGRICRAPRFGPLSRYHAPLRGPLIVRPTMKRGHIEYRWIEAGFPIWSWYPAPQNRRRASMFLGSDARGPATKGDTPWVRKNPSPFSSPSTAF